MSLFDANQVSDTIYEFLTTSKNPALFAGSGVGAQAGLPTWKQFVEHLAIVASSYEPIIGELIRKWGKSGHYLSAASVYKSNPEVPHGELYKQLAVPFTSPPYPEKLNALVSLPFSAIFTTNYDRSLHDAFANVVGKSPIAVELEDPTMIRAPFLTDFYIARIHGRAELPETIVFAEDDYKRIRGNECYVDFVWNAFTRYSCLFLGFSFLDPAINQVFQTLEDKLAPGFPQLHLAVLPSDADSSLKALLARFNIKTIQYDAADQHFALWEGIRLASRGFIQTEKTEKPAAIFPLDTVKRFLATSYARIQMGDDILPLRDLVVDGMIMNILTEADGEEIIFDEIATHLQKYIPMSEHEAKQLTRRRIELLDHRGWCQVSNDSVLLTRRTSNELREGISTLVKGILDRLKVREAQPITFQAREVAEQCIEEVLLARSWDLGAHYAGAAIRKIPDIFPTISKSVEKHGIQLGIGQREGLSRACYDLFQHPNREESIVLAELGRIAFGLQLVINAPCSSITHQDVLPERIYLDANVLMPAIIDGHPYRPAYVDSIRRLGQASQAASIPIGVFIAKDFLNEVISHREIAQREVGTMWLERPRSLSKHMLYYGAENANVFVGAYGSWVGRQEKEISFSEFLRRVAPYSSEEELSRYLVKEGIKTDDLYFEPGDEIDLYHKIKVVLEDAYQSDRTWKYNPKRFVLIEHEARQLTRLVLDLKYGIRAIFVTADERLRRLAADIVTREVGHAIISHRGLVQLIDMLVGVKSDPVSLARLIWGGGLDDEAAMIRDYYTALALQHYNDAMAMTLPEVLNAFVPEVIRASEREGVDLFPGGNVESKSRTARFLDRFEDQFYASMAEVIREKVPDEYNFVNEIRRSQLKEHIEQLLEMVGEYEARLHVSEDPHEKVKLRADLMESRKLLSHYQEELRNIQLDPH